MRDFFEMVVAPVACVALGLAVLLAAADLFARYQCSNFHAITGKATKYAGKFDFKCPPTLACK